MIFNNKLHIGCLIVLMIIISSLLGSSMAFLILSQQSNEEEIIYYENIIDRKNANKGSIYNLNEPYIAEDSIVIVTKCEKVSTIPYMDVNNMVIRIKVIFINTSARAQPYSFHFFTAKYGKKILYQEGKEFEMPESEPMLTLKNVYPGDSHIGWVYLEIPKDNEVFEFKYNDAIFLLDSSQNN